MNCESTANQWTGAGGSELWTSYVFTSFSPEVEAQPVARLSVLGLDLLEDVGEDVALLAEHHPLVVHGGRPHLPLRHAPHLRLRERTLLVRHLVMGQNITPYLGPKFPLTARPVYHCDSFHFMLDNKRWLKE